MILVLEALQLPFRAVRIGDEGLVRMSGPGQPAERVVGESAVRLLDKFQRLQELDKRDREAVIILIDGVLARRAVESAIASAR